MKLRYICISCAFVLAGCTGIYEKDWEIVHEYCQTMGSDHFRGPPSADKIDTDWNLLTSNMISRVRGGTPFQLTVTEVEFDKLVVWAEATWDPAHSGDPAHTECVKLQRADVQLGQTAIEVFIHQMPSSPLTCKDAITEDFINKVRLHDGVTVIGCVNQHQGGWKAL